MKSHEIASPSVSQKYSMLDLTKATLHWVNVGIRFITSKPMLIAMACSFSPFREINAASSSTTSGICQADLSPLQYSWQQLCPAIPPTKAFVNKKQAKKLNRLKKNYIVYSNWPLEHVQVFAFGATHGRNSEIVPNDHLFRKAVSKISKPNDRILFEGMDKKVMRPCSQFRNVASSAVFPRKDSVTCQGWEEEAVLSITLEAVKKMQDFAKNIEGTSTDRMLAKQLQIKELHKTKDKLHEKLNSLKLRLLNPSSLDLFLLFINWFDVINLITSIDEEVQLIVDSITQTIANIELISDEIREIVSSVPSEATETYNKVSIIERNKSMIQVVDDALVSRPNQRVYIRGGTHHFFSISTNTMSRYVDSDEVAEVRKYFEKLESKGTPVAFLYPRKDTNANLYLKDLEVPKTSKRLKQ